jgi:hypothetical protein
MDQHMARKAEMDAINAEIAAKNDAMPGTVNKRVGAAPEPEAPRETEVMSLLDATHANDFDIPAPPPAAPKPKGSAIDALSDFARMQEQKAAGAPSVQSSPVSPIDAKKQAIIDAQKANPDALAAFGVDPRAGERGFDPFQAYMTYKGIKGGADLIKKGAKAAAPTIYRTGQRIEQAAQQAASDPGMLMQLMREGGAVGGAARAMMQSIQQGDQSGLKARTALLVAMPEFRARFGQDTEEQDAPASAASGF